MVQTSISFTSSESEVSWESGHFEVLSPYGAMAPGAPQEGPAAKAYEPFVEPDRFIGENRHVRCSIVRPMESRTGTDIGRACVLLHGLNERSWDKYRNWAQAIADKANCAVVLFPIAFHMDRAPESWASFPLMRVLSKDRVARYPGLRKSSMANAALSERLDEAPDRFYRSGLMAALDLVDLVDRIRAGDVPGIASGADLGFFGYSIGAYLLQCMALADSGFAASGRRFLFCGGPYLSAMRPESKYIMDSRAHERLLDFWVYNLSEALRSDEELADLLDTTGGRAYRAMVDPKYPQLDRRDLFSDGNTRVAALSGDEVMPKDAIERFFSGTGVIPTFFDLPASCTHIAPFNPIGGGQAAADAFVAVFDLAVEHLFG